MELFKNREVYKYSYTYEEVKIAMVVSDVAVSNKIILDYEDICIIAKIIYAYWDDPTFDEEFDILLKMFPWMEIESKTEDEQYSQVYAERTALNYIRLYQLMTNN